MSACAPSLIALLRRHLRVVALLFAGLLLMKSVFAVSCATEASGDFAAAYGVTAPLQADAIMAGTCEIPDASDCWHDGAGGCHCACAHATPLPQTASGPVQIVVVATLFPSALRYNAPAPPEDALRPPIA